MTMQATVQIKYVNAPKRPGGKYGSIKAADDSFFFVPVGFLSHFAVGEQCAVTYEQQNWGDKPVNVAVAKNGTTLANLAAGQQSPPIQATPAPQASRPRTPEHDAQALSIFVTGIVGRAMGSGQFGVNDIKALAYAAKEAFEEVVQGHASPHVSQPHPGMDDGPPPGDPRFQDPLG